MKAFVVNAFTKSLFEGNQAGVIFMETKEDLFSEELMQKIAAELGYSETAFVHRINNDTFKIRYFTPVSAVDLCGHATIGCFSMLRQENIIANGFYDILTAAGSLKVNVIDDYVWMESAFPSIAKTINEADAIELYDAYALSKEDMHPQLKPMAVSSGLTDIMLPVASKDALMKAIQDKQEVISLSRKHNVVGVHMFALSNEKEVTAYCSNFAPLYGIDEECATGTSNAALTYYLHYHGLLEEHNENTFIQGEHMGRRAEIKSILSHDKEKTEILIGGSAVISKKLNINSYD